MAVGIIIVGRVPALVAVLGGVDVARAGGVVALRVVAAPSDAGVVERLRIGCIKKQQIQQFQIMTMVLH